MSNPPVGPVYFVLGGPGSGKGTNCGLLVEEFGLSHYSAGDLLRAEAKKDNELGKKITEILAAGQIVPMEVTIGLLGDNMARDPNPKGYLLDGFPRKMDQALKFEEDVCKAKNILFFDLPEEEMLKRVKARAASGSGRADDDEAILRKRFATNVTDCMPVIEKYRNEGRLLEINTNKSVEEVYATVRQIFIDAGYQPIRAPSVAATASQAPTNASPSQSMGATATQ